MILSELLLGGVHWIEIVSNVVLVTSMLETFTASGTSEGAQGELYYYTILIARLY